MAAKNTDSYTCILMSKTLINRFQVTVWFSKVLAVLGSSKQSEVKASFYLPSSYIPEKQNVC